MRLLTLVLPILWALVATVVGLLLYKTSKGLFDETTNSSRRTRRIRLTGSVVIAAASYLGMWAATPGERLREFPKDTLTLSAGEAREIMAIAYRIDTELLQLSGCLATYSNPNPCEPRIVELRSATASLVNRLKAWKAQATKEP